MPWSPDHESTANAASKKVLERRHDAPVKSDMIAAAKRRIRAKVTHKITPTVIDAIEAGVGAGNYADVVARAIGVTDQTFAKWQEEGEERLATGNYADERDPDGRYAELALRTSVADAKFEMATVEKMQAEADKGRGTWNAAMTILQRKYPERWERKEDARQNEKSFEERVREMFAEQADA